MHSSAPFWYDAWCIATSLVGVAVGSCVASERPVMAALLVLAGVASVVFRSCRQAWRESRALFCVDLACAVVALTWALASCPCQRPLLSVACVCMLMAWWDWSRGHYLLSCRKHAMGHLLAAGAAVFLLKKW